MPNSRGFWRESKKWEIVLRMSMVQSIQKGISNPKDNGKRSPPTSLPKSPMTVSHQMPASLTQLLQLVDILRIMLASLDFLWCWYIRLKKVELVCMPNCKLFVMDWIAPKCCLDSRWKRYIGCSILWLWWWIWFQLWHLVFTPGFLYAFSCLGARGLGIYGSKTPWAGHMVKPDIVFHCSDSPSVVVEADEDYGHSVSQKHSISKCGAPWEYSRDLNAELAKMKTCARAC